MEGNWKRSCQEQLDVEMRNAEGFFFHWEKNSVTVFLFLLFILREFIEKKGKISVIILKVVRLFNQNPSM